MNRASIEQRIEQKRQRIEELKRKRLRGEGLVKNGDELVSNEEVAPFIETTDSSQVEQVEVIEPIPPEESKPTLLKTIKVSKNVQTDKVRHITVPQTKTPPPEPPKFELPVELNYNEDQLYRLVQDAIIMLNKVLITDTPQTSKHANFDETDIISFETEFYPLPERIPLKISIFNSNILVLFNSIASQDYRGYAVIYTKFNNKLIPIKYLGSLWPISVIKLFNDSKVIAGCKTGRICVWDLNETTNEVILLPSLSTPTNFINKNLPQSDITSINILDDNLFVTTCLSGLINFWSVNFLEYPKFTMTIANQQDLLVLLAKPYQEITNAILVNESQEANHENYLNNLIISTNSQVIRLVNDPKMSCIKSSFDIKVDTLNLLGLKDTIPIIGITCKDCNIHIYNSTTKILTIPTNYMVLGLVPRLNNHFQFVSYGLYDEIASELTSCVEFWDLNRKLYKPVHCVNINSGEHPISCGFDDNVVYLGFSDGKVSCFSIDDERLMKIAMEDTIHDRV